MAPVIPGLILAGGRASRLGGGDKALRTVGGTAILDRIVATLAPQCDRLLLNANGDPSRFADLRLPVVPDSVAGHPGPLAGVLAGLDWLVEHRPDARYAVTVPSDTPFLPADLVRRLYGAITDAAPLACARSGANAHYTIALWPVGLRRTLRRALVDDGLRRAGAFFAAQAVTYVDWPTTPFDPFLNINTPDDQATADRIATHRAP